MEDQGKRLLLAVGIIGVLFVVWTFLFSPTPAERPPQQAAPAQTTPAAPAAGAAGTPAAPGGTTPAAAAPAQAQAEAPEAACEPETDGAPRWDTPEYTATFSRCGAALSSFVLKGKQYTETRDGKEVQMDLVRARGNPAQFPLQVQVLASPPGVVSPEAQRASVAPERAAWTLVSADGESVVYSYTGADGVTLTKTFRRLPGRYAMTLDYEIKNGAAKRVVESAVTAYGFQDPNVRDPSMFHYAEPTWGTACYIGDSLKHDQAKELRGETRSESGKVSWVAVAHQYFLVAIAPLHDEAATCVRQMVQGSNGVLLASLAYGVPTTLEAGATLKRQVAVYVGPKLIDELGAVNQLVQRETHLREAVDLGWFAILCRPMLYLLKLFHSWVGSWGVAIVFLTIVVKLLTLYWTTKSMRSMKAMSKLKPEMDRIKEKFPDDRARQNQEMMNLYKTHQISPFGGCLPLLLQMPIWFALYRTLASAAELYRAPFLGYIRDLTAPDPYYILPIVLTATMFVQARITPASIDSQQQKIMQWMMPIMMGVFSLLFPAGLAVYMLTNTVLGMGHQVYMNRTEPKPAAAPAATAPAPSAPAKASQNAAPANRPPRKSGKNRAKA
jgi:YidC/Oxa1 family membrane protein insertase